MKRNAQWKQLTIIFVVAVIFNFLWEMAQMRFYAGVNNPKAAWYCFVASLGDGLLVLLILGVGRVVLGDGEWFKQPGVGGYLLMLLMGFLIGIIVELAAVRVGKVWGYSPQMLLVPALNIGLLPLLQMVVLPPVIFRMVAMWSDHRMKN